MRIRNYIRRLFLPGSYVELDPRDNSVTLSPKLWKRIRRKATGGSGRMMVFVFRETFSDRYGFCVNPTSLNPEETQMAEIQYNPKYRCVGFETLNPSVGRMLYDYGFPYNRAVRLTVTRRLAGGLFPFYRIETPCRK